MITIVAGSSSDKDITKKIEDILTENNVDYETFIASAHREPDKVRDIVKNSRADIFICVAGLSAALPGFVASLTEKPVIGVPVKSTTSVADGLDALLSVSQMPPGVPVACVGIDNGKNAALLAYRILRLKEQRNRPAKEELVKKGKVKDIYDLGDRLMFVFSDRVSAFDVVIPDEIEHKGEVLCRMSEHFFRTLGVPNHMIEAIRPNKMIVKKLELVPIECVVRGFLYGSLLERVKKGEAYVPIPPIQAARLPEPLFDPTTKFEKKDRPVTREEIIDRGWLTGDEYDWIRKKSIEIYKRMSAIAERSGFILADLKLEFGRDNSGQILLADSIGPDEFRLWSKEKYSPGRTQDSYDKQPVRDWLIMAGFKDELDRARRLGKPEPDAPRLPEELKKEVIGRYIYAFEKLSGERFV